MQKDQLIKLIHDSFDGVSRPTDITLHVAEAHDNYDYEHNDLHRLKDCKGRWQEIPEEHISGCPNALPHLDAYGIRYYLPAYMVWYLLNPDSDSWAYDSTLYTLNDHARDAELSLYFESRYSLLSAEQMLTCREFVAFCMVDKDVEHDTVFATQIYESYWSKLGQF